MPHIFKKITTMEMIETMGCCRNATSFFCGTTLCGTAMHSDTISSV